MGESEVDTSHAAYMRGVCFALSKLCDGLKKRSDFKLVVQVEGRVFSVYLNYGGVLEFAEEMSKSWCGSQHEYWDHKTMTPEAAARKILWTIQKRLLQDCEQS